MLIQNFPLSVCVQNPPPIDVPPLPLLLQNPALTESRNVGSHEGSVETVLIGESDISEDGSTKNPPNLRKTISKNPMQRLEKNVRFLIEFSAHLKQHTNLV